MKSVLMVISFTALLWLLVAPLLFYAGTVDLSSMKLQMLLATIVWFVLTPIWIGKESQDADAADEPQANV